MKKVLKTEKVLIILDFNGYKFMKSSQGRNRVNLKKCDFLSIESKVLKNHHYSLEI